MTNGLTTISWQVCDFENDNVFRTKRALDCLNVLYQRSITWLSSGTNLHALILVFGAVAGTAFEEVVVGFDVRSEINHFARFQLPDGIKHGLSTFIIRTFEMTSETDIANVLAAFGGISRGNFVFREDGGIWTFRDARAAVNAGVGINIDPRPFVDGLTGNHAFDGADFNATTVTNA